jgi:hypothetical protein
MLALGLEQTLFISFDNIGGIICLVLCWDGIGWSPIKSMRRELTTVRGYSLQ